MATRTLSQNSRFHTLITMRGLDREEKAELVWACTNGRTSSSKEMTADEMATAIGILEDEQAGSVKRMRAKIINIARDIFELQPRDQWEQRHYDALNTFLLKKFKQPLHKLTYNDLRNAVTAMERWRETEMQKMLNGLLNGI